MRRSILSLLIIAVIAGVSQADIYHYSDKGQFDNAILNFEMGPVIDFEDIAPAGDITTYYPSYTYSYDGKDVVFTGNDRVDIADQAAEFPTLNDGPFQSDVIYAYYNNDPLVITLPAETTVVGGFFGELVNSPLLPVGESVITLRDAWDNILFQQVCDIAEMTAGGTFYGWVSYDTPIAKVEHHVDVSANHWAGLDNFYHGVIPEPGSVAMLVSGCLCGIAIAWRRRRRQS